MLILITIPIFIKLGNNHYLPSYLKIFNKSHSKITAHYVVLDKLNNNLIKIIERFHHSRLELLSAMFLRKKSN
jgi:hypothetical protein